MAAETATGVPKPAAPSKKAPKQKAMMISCSRRSAVIRAHGILEDGEIAFVHREAVKEDHIDDDPADGEEAADKAQTVALAAMSAGMWKAKMATSNMAARAISAAQWDLTLPVAISASSSTMGKAALTVDMILL